MTEKAKTPHTKGKWHAVGAWVEHENDDIPDICNCSPESMGQEGRDYDEACANARLLAAAPEMLAIVRKLSRRKLAGDDLVAQAKQLLRRL